MAEEFVNIRIKKDEIRAQLEKLIKPSSAHHSLITKVIIDHLSEKEVGLQQLYKAFSGIEETCKYEVGDRMWMKESETYSWKNDKQKMLEENLVFQDMIPCVIKAIYLTRSKPYEITYMYIDKTTGKADEQSLSVSEEQLIPKDRYPLSL